MKTSRMIAIILLYCLISHRAIAHHRITDLFTDTQDWSPNDRPVHVELKVLLVQFNDVECKKDSRGRPQYAATDFVNLLGSEGIYASPNMFSPDGDEVFGSVSDYFRIMSGGRVLVNATIVNRCPGDNKRPLWITLGNSKEHYHSDWTYSLFDDALEEARKSGLDVSTSEDSRLVIIYAGNLWTGGGLNPIRFGPYYIMSECQGRPYGQEDPDARFSRIGIHCHEFAHTLGIGHSSGSRADLMESGYRNGSVEGNAPAPLNAITRMKQGWANVITLPDTGALVRTMTYSLTDPTYVKMTNSRGDVFLVENRCFDQSMLIGNTNVPDYNNGRFNPLAWPHGTIQRGILAWRMNGVQDGSEPSGYSSEGLIYASGRYGRTYPEGNPSETDDGVPFPGVSNTRILSPWSDPRDPYTREQDFFDSTRFHYTLHVPNTKGGSNLRMEIVSEDKTQGCFTVLFSASTPSSYGMTGVLSAGEAPKSYALSQNYPNPFNPATTISYQLSAASMITLKVMDVLGREIATLVDERKDAGFHTVQWNASSVPSGSYFYRLQARSIDAQRAEFTETKRMTLLR